MTYHAAEDPGVRLPWFQKKSVLIIVAAVLCLLAAGVGFFTYTGVRNIPDIGGSMTFEAAPDTRIYIGDKLVGTTQATVTWAQLLGNENQEPLAIELSATETVTAELISGAGAKILERRNHATSHSPTMDDREDSYLIRRADGALDHVEVYLIELTGGNEYRRLVILLRARKGAAGSTISFERHGGGGPHFSSPGFVKAFGKSPIELVDFWRLSHYMPPDEFNEEVKKNGYWEPGAP